MSALLPGQIQGYLHWSEAGGPNECEHGFAEGIPCPHCDGNPKQAALRAEVERLRQERNLQAITERNQLDTIARLRQELTGANGNVAELMEQRADFAAEVDKLSHAVWQLKTLLMEVKGWRDSVDNEPFPHGLRLAIDAALEAKP